MAETVETSTEAQVQETQPSVEELRAFAFNKPTPQQQTESINGGGQTSTTETAAGTSTETATNTAVVETNTQSTADFNAYLKEHFGVDNLETAKTEWQTLQQLKANPPKPEAFKFENEESEKLARAISTNPKEAFKILQKQERIENLVSIEVNKDNAADIIKFGIELANPSLTPQEIEFQYKQEYVAPKEPVQKATEDDDEFAERHSEWKERGEAIEMKRTIAAKMAQPQLAAAKQKIDISSILSSNEIVDKDYEAYKASNASAEQFYNTVSPQITALKPADVPLVINVNDANNKMQFDISIIPEEADFETARQDSLTWDVFKTCYDKDGKFIPQNLQKIALIAKNFDKYGQAIARQAVNAERKRVIEAETAGGGLQRNFNTQVEPTELDALKQFAFQKVG